MRVGNNIGNVSSNGDSTYSLFHVRHRSSVGDVMAYAVVYVGQ